MLRIENSDGWTLIEHREHARLAGDFARFWGNADFKRPEPFDDILVAVSRHDDAWAERDAEPCLTREGRPSAFSEELVGRYSAFEEIDLLEYLAVRGRATEAVAADNAYAAIIVSMHTDNLLTEQADLRRLPSGEREAHALFIAGQRARQGQLVAEIAAVPGRAAEVAPEALRRAFEFLQACDNLSLLACVNFNRTSTLRHSHPLRTGLSVQLQCTPLGNATFRVSPYPFSRDELEFVVPCRDVLGRTFADEAILRAAYQAAPERKLTVRIVR
jgi:hypothetical protein